MSGGLWCNGSTRRLGRFSPGSNPGSPIVNIAGVAQWQCTWLPTKIRGFDSLHPLSPLVVQWTERRVSNPLMQVRILPRG